MAVQAGEAYIPIRADMSSFGKEVEAGVDQGSSRVLGKAKGIGAKVGGVMAAGAAASFAKDFFGSAIGGARESKALARQTAQVIKTTGGAANVSAEGVGELSSQLSKKTAVDDEVIQSGANMLLTFTNLRNEMGEGNDIFDQSVGLANDMSVALGQDMKSSSLQLGKALNDPIKGVGALQRVGVSFTDQQKEQIKTLVASGDTLGAQKVILGELNTQFGGSAAAQADASKKMGVAWGNFQETIGSMLLPVVDKVLGALTSITTWATENPGAFKAIAAVIGGAMVAAFGAWAVAAIGASIATGSLVWPILLIGGAIAGLIAGVYLLWTNWDKVWGWVSDKVSAVMQAVTRFISDRVGDIVGFFKGLPGRLAGAAGDLFGFLWSSFKGALNRIVTAWNDFKIPSVTIGGWDIPGPGPNVPSFTTPEINFPNIPRFHEGGVFDAPGSRREGLAMLLDGERVLSPAESERYGQGRPVELHFHDSGHDAGSVLSAFAWAVS